jgi:hypothetical protein
MKNFIMWFWTNINFRKWTFEDRKLNNPLAILRKIVLLPIMYIMLCLYAIMLIIYNFGTYEALEFWESQS